MARSFEESGDARWQGPVFVDVTVKEGLSGEHIQQATQASGDDNGELQSAGRSGSLHR